MFSNKKKDLSKGLAPPPSKLRKLNNGNFMANMAAQHHNNSSNVNVFVRVRPTNEKESSDNYRTVVKVVDEKLLIFDPKENQEPFFFHGTRQKMRDINKKQNKQLEFLFDGVFGPDTSNVDIHFKTTCNIIGNLLDGYNCSVFVYGATGAGKTFTMLGKRDHTPGIMYHTMAELYKQINAVSKEKKCDVGVSFVEVYNENVFDLLHPSQQPLFLREDTSGVTIVGLKVENIYNADQLLEKLAQGNSNRSQHPTDSNAESSRSHAVFQVYIRMMALDNQQVKISKLSMIDLAGSERGMATGFKGMRFKEGSNINKSLLALGNCISSLADNLRHIPYRDSKLTRLLKDSLGGNCQTIMIANISPSSASYEDTYNTLKFASRAKKITTKLTKNILSSDMGVSHYMMLVDKLETENTLLKSKVRALEKTVTDSARANSDMPDISVWCNHLNQIFDEKVYLCRRLLKVKSEAHLLEWRITNKNFAKDVVEISSGVDGCETTLNRIESSVGSFGKQLNALQSCMRDLNTQLEENNDKLAKLFNEMEEARVLQYMQKDLELKNGMLHSTIQEVTNKHLTRLLMLQQKRAETNETALKMREPLLNNYHMILSGLNMVTHQMAEDYKKAVNTMNDVKNLTWCDADYDGMDAGMSGTNVLSAINLSFDDALFSIDTHHQTTKLKPITLSITDAKDDEVSDIDPILNRLDGDEQITDEALVNRQVEEERSEVSGVTAPDTNDIIKEEDEDEDSANSTITLETPTISLHIPEVSATDSTDIAPLSAHLTSNSLIGSTKLSSLNETVTIDGVSLPSVDTLPLEKVTEAKNEKVNSIFIKAKQNRMIFNNPNSFKKINSVPMQKSDKENIVVVKQNSVTGKLKESCGSKQLGLKTPAINHYRFNRISSSTRQALKPKPVNSTILSATVVPAVKPEVPCFQSLKIIRLKNRTKSHPYKRPETNLKTADKRR